EGKRGGEGRRRLGRRPAGARPAPTASLSGAVGIGLKGGSGWPWPSAFSALRPDDGLPGLWVERLPPVGPRPPGAPPRSVWGWWRRPTGSFNSGARPGERASPPSRCPATASSLPSAPQPPPAGAPRVPPPLTSPPPSPANPGRRRERARLRGPAVINGCFEVGLHIHPEMFCYLRPVRRFCLEKILPQWFIRSRALSGAEAVNALRPFYFAVHPDFFGQHPREREVNENSLKKLSVYLESIQKPGIKSLKPTQLTFYVRETEQNSSESQESFSISGIFLVQFISLQV
uniref:T cell activation inhibitor, mitochondrial n=1 Tax=Ornithorhynchus anatinus TaxID=9258 RepID=A0A6I8N0B9_ORNAN